MDILNTKITSLPISQLVNNEGQIPDVPKNPRNITEDEFKKLVQSIKQDNLTGVEPLKVFAHGGSYVVLGGNQRLRALLQLGIKDVPCIVVPGNTPADVLRKIVINDNSNYGEWNMDDLANEWDTDELQDWSVDVPSFEEEQQDEKREKQKGISIVYEIVFNTDKEQAEWYDWLRKLKIEYPDLEIISERILAKIRTIE